MKVADMLDELIRLVRGKRREREKEEASAPGLAALVKLLEHENRDLALACDGLYERERTLRRALTKLDERHKELRVGLDELTMTAHPDANYMRERMRALLDKTALPKKDE